MSELLLEGVVLVEDGAVEDGVVLVWDDWSELLVLLDGAVALGVWLFWLFGSLLVPDV